MKNDRPLLESNLATGLLVALIAVVGVAIRCYDLTTRSIWFDEAWSWRMSQFPFGELLSRTARDVHPPLYYLLLKAWLAVWGSSVLAMRSLSVILGGLTIAAMYGFVAEAFGDAAGATRRSRAVGLLTACLVALSVFQIRFAWEARMYTLGTFLTAMSSWALFRAIRSTPSWRRWAAYSIWTVLLLYTHYYGILLVVAQILVIAGWLLVRHRLRFSSVLRGSELWHAVFGLATVAICWLPWLPVFLRQRIQVASGFWTAPINKWELYQVNYQMFVEPENSVLLPAHAIGLTVVVCGVLVSLLWRPTLASCYILLAALVPFGLSILVTHLGTGVFHTRYFLYAHLFVLAALAFLVARVPFRVERTAYIVMLIGVFAWVDIRFVRRLDMDNRPGSRAAAEFIQVRREEGEPVVIAHPLLYFPFKYYANDDPAWRVFDDGQGVTHYHGEPILTLDELMSERKLHEIQSGRVWIIESTGGQWGDLILRVPDQWVCKSERRFPEVWRVQGEIVVREFVTRDVHND